jgi:PKD repeat protein
VITAGSATSFCSGGSVTLSTNATAGIQWFNGTTPVGSGLNTFNATQSGSYTAAVTTGNCVSTSNAITVTVNSVTVPTITASATEICTGGTATLSSSSDPNYVSYLWNNNLGTTASVTTQNSGTYTVTVTASNGCSATSASVTITVGGTITQPQVTIGGSTILCQGQTVTLLSNSITGNQWNFNGTPLTGATGVTFTADATGLYSVTVTANGCVSTSANIPVIVNPLPNASGSAVSQVGGITTFTNTSQNANAYQWNFGDQTAFSNDNNPVHTFTTDGEFTVILTAYNSCGSDADTIQINVFGTSVRALTHGEKLSMYPNPTHDQIMVDFSDNGSKNLRVNLVSITGEIVFTETLNSFSGKYKQLIDMQNLSSGIYFINIHTDRDTITRKVVKN